jgi:ADP-ribose pyrophosphatase YjhB (NUDIX family)
MNCRRAVLQFIVRRSYFIVYDVRMLKGMVSRLWRGAPRFVRRACVLLTQPRFTVTAGVIVSDERGRVLLLRHVLRGGSGWGVPGGFIAAGEQPEDAVRREVREETGLALEEVALAFVRTHEHVRQVEIIFRGRMRSDAVARLHKSFEIDRADWFALDALPEGIDRDQRRVIARALSTARANAPE